MASNKTPQDDELIRLAQRGDLDAYASIVTLYKDRVFSLLRRSVHDFNSAEDLSQEVFIRAYRGLKGFRFDCTFSSWLMRIAINVSSTHRASTRFRQSQVTDSVEDDLVDNSSTNGEQDALQRERLLALNRCLQKLSGRLRDAVTLIGLHGSSYEEASETLQIPVGTVRSRLNQARILLSKCLSLHGDAI